MQEPLERKLGQRMVLTRSQRHTRPYLKIKHECAYDIPLLLSLKQLSNRFIFEEVSKHGELYIDALKCC